jgi:hypothetical protein
MRQLYAKSEIERVCLVESAKKIRTIASKAAISRHKKWLKTAFD